MNNKKQYKQISPDPSYNSITVAKFINHIMRKGKKAPARKIMYQALEQIKQSSEEPVEALETAIGNATPRLEVKSMRIGGATYQVPKRVSKERGKTLAMRWIVEAAKKKKGKPMRESLAQEILDASNNQGKAIKKKRNIHRMAEANKAFAHFAR